MQIEGIQVCIILWLPLLFWIFLFKPPFCKRNCQTQKFSLQLSSLMINDFKRNCSLSLLFLLDPHRNDKFHNISASRHWMKQYNGTQLMILRWLTNLFTNAKLETTCFITVLSLKWFSSSNEFAWGWLWEQTELYVTHGTVWKLIILTVNCCISVNSGLCALQLQQLSDYLQSNRNPVLNIISFLIILLFCVVCSSF